MTHSKYVMIETPILKFGARALQLTNIAGETKKNTDFVLLDFKKSGRIIDYNLHGVLKREEKQLI